MNNCLVTTLKDSVDIENPQYLGYVLVYVQNTSGASRGVTRNSADGSVTTTFPVGSRVMGEGTFSTGKKIVETGDSALIPDGAAMTVLIPKYDFFVYGLGQPSSGSLNTTVAVNIDDFDYFFSHLGAGVELNLSSTMANFSGTPDGHKSSGNIEKFISKLSDGGLHILTLSNSEIAINLDNTELVYKKTVSGGEFNMVGDTHISGNLETFISNWIQANKTAALASTSTTYIRIYNSSANSNYFNPSLDSAIQVRFSGTSTVTIVQGGTSVQYDINSDTWTA